MAGPLVSANHNTIQAVLMTINATSPTQAHGVYYAIVNYILNYIDTAI